MNKGALALRNLATRMNAYRVAQNHFDDTGLDHAVIETGDPYRPFVVLPHNNQPNIVVAFIACGDDLNLIRPGQ